MKRWTRAVGLGAATLGLVASTVTAADADLAVTTSDLALAAPVTDVAAAGVSLEGTPTDSIDLGLPADATVDQVLLYWAGNFSPSGSPDDTIEVEGDEVTGEVIGEPGGTPFYRLRINKKTQVVKTQAYRADITDLGVVGPGANLVEVGGLDFDVKALGAGLIVLYSVPGEKVSEVHLNEGLDVAFANFKNPLSPAVTVVDDVDFAVSPQSTDRTGTLKFHLGSVGEDRSAHVSVLVDGVPQTTFFHTGKAGDAEGAEWDVIETPFNLPADSSDVTVRIASAQDPANPNDTPGSIELMAAVLEIDVLECEPTFEAARSEADGMALDIDWPPALQPVVDQLEPVVFQTTGIDLDDPNGVIGSSLLRVSPDTAGGSQTSSDPATTIEIPDVTGNLGGPILKLDLVKGTATSAIDFVTGLPVSTGRTELVLADVAALGNRVTVEKIHVIADALTDTLAPQAKTRDSRVEGATVLGDSVAQELAGGTRQVVPDLGTLEILGHANPVATEVTPIGGALDPDDVEYVASSTVTGLRLVVDAPILPAQLEPLRGLVITIGQASAGAETLTGRCTTPSEGVADGHADAVAYAVEVPGGTTRLDGNVAHSQLDLSAPPVDNDLLGGDDRATVVGAVVPDVVATEKARSFSAGNAHDPTGGTPVPTVNSLAAVEGLDLFGGQLTASAVLSDATATATGAGTVFDTSKGHLVDLVLGGTNICEALSLTPVCKPAPNTVVIGTGGILPLPLGLTVTLNEQIGCGDADTTCEVNMIRVTASTPLPIGADVKVAHVFVEADL